VAYRIVDVRMVEQVKVVQPAELSSVLGRERDMTAVGAHAMGTGRQEENVSGYAADRMRRVASDGGGDGIVARVREQLNRAAVVQAARVGIAVAPVVLGQVAVTEVFDARRYVR
jgi:hypothetical protein